MDMLKPRRVDSFGGCARVFDSIRCGFLYTPSRAETQLVDASDSSPTRHSGPRLAPWCPNP